MKDKCRLPSVTELELALHTSSTRVRKERHYFYLTLNHNLVPVYFVFPADGIRFKFVVCEVFFFIFFHVIGMLKTVS